MNWAWRHSIHIALAAALLIAAGAAYYYHGQSEGRAADLRQASADYEALSAEYAGAQGDLLALQASHDNLTARYALLSENYTRLLSDTSSGRADYDRLKASVDNFTEQGGPAIALYYRSYRSGTGEAKRLYVQATVYNVGDRSADAVTVHCRVIYMGQPNLNDQAFTDIAPLEKRSYTWQFDVLSQLDTVWVT